MSCGNKSLTCPGDNVQVFKDPGDKRLEMLLKASYAKQLAMAAIRPISPLQADDGRMSATLVWVPLTFNSNAIEMRVCSMFPKHAFSVCHVFADGNGASLFLCKHKISHSGPIHT